MYTIFTLISDNTDKEFIFDSHEHIMYSFHINKKWAWYNKPLVYSIIIWNEDVLQISIVGIYVLYYSLYFNLFVTISSKSSHSFGQNVRNTTKGDGTSGIPWKMDDA